MREAFEASTGLALSEAQWQQATLALSRGGLGLRSATRHAAAAYLASRTATRELCRAIDPAYEWDPAAPGDGVLEAASDSAVGAQCRNQP